MKTLFNQFSTTSSFLEYYSETTEMAAYEAIWSLNRKINFKKLSEDLVFSHKLPSELIDSALIESTKKRLINRFLKKPGFKFEFLISKSFDYPRRLKDAKEPVEVIYFRGYLELINTRSIAIVGSRKPTKEGMIRAEKLAKMLVKEGFTIISGLASGIDTIAHQTAIKYGGNTIAVIGTPLDVVYPKQNKELQEFIANEHLIISQVPFLRYDEQTFHGNRLFFPERNKTMSAISEATIIVEASDTSGTLIQAKAALEQGRKLFILQSCFENKNITWPAKFEALGAIRVIELSDILKNLPN